MKKCSKCKLTKELSEFSVKNKTTGKRHQVCKPCRCDEARFKEYGITRDQYAELLHKQGGVCMICHGVNSDGRVLFVDHCHTSGKIRGLLCNQCNIGLGMFKDSVLYLESAIKYLQNTT